MELLCPHCFKRVTVPDDRAGQVVNCPLCAKAFGAPALSPPLPVPPIQVTGNTEPAPPSLAYELAPPPPPPLPRPPSTAITPAPPPRPVVVEPPPPPPPPPLPPGEYTHTVVLRLRPEVLAWLPPVCLGMLFVLSFFPWHLPSVNLWQLGFTDHGNGLFATYVLVTVFLALPLSVASLSLDLRHISLPPGLRPWVPWKTAVVAAVLLGGLMPLGIDYLGQHFHQTENYIAVAMKLGARVHLLAFLAAVLEVWLQYRRRWNLPLPRMEVRW